MTPLTVFLYADAVTAVFMGNIVIDRNKLPVVLPGEGHPLAILQEIANCVISDGLPVVTSQFVFPVGVLIPVGLDCC